MAAGATLLDMAAYFKRSPSELCAWEVGEAEPPENYLEEVATFIERAAFEQRDDVRRMAQAMDQMHRIMNDAVEDAHPDEEDMHPDAVFARKYMAGDPETLKQAGIFDGVFAKEEE